MKLVILLASVLLLSTEAFGEGRAVTASNGVQVDVRGDEFDGETQYTSPIVKFDDFSFFLVASIKRNGKVGPILVSGSVFYNGEWRNYRKANFRGGESANAIFTDRNVVTCAGRGSCTLSEGFQITLTPSQITKYETDGVVALKLKASASNEEPVIRVPVNYIAAVQDVASR